jgi:hypothetical protein
LESESSKEDSQEPAIVEEALEYIEIILSYLSAVDIVENLKEYETIENFGDRLSLEKT